MNSKIIPALFALILAPACDAAREINTVREAETTVRIRESALRAAPPAIRLDAIRRTPVPGNLIVNPSLLAVNPQRTASAMSAVDLRGNAIPVRAVAGGEVAVASNPGQWVVLKPAQTETVQMIRGTQWLPGICIPPAPDGASPQSQGLLSYADFASVPVVWDQEIDAYRLDAAIGVARGGDPTVSGPLGATASVKLAFDGITAEPAELAIDQLGLIGEKRVSLTFTRTNTRVPRIVVRSNVAADQPFSMDVRPRVDIKVRDNPILGLGLERTTITLECVQPHGALLPLGTGVPIQLTLSGARSEEAGLVELSDAKKLAEVAVRSVGLGDIRVFASARMPTEEILGSTTIRTTLPLGQLAAALAGGMLGGFARRFVKGARKSATAMRIAEGAVISVIAFVAGVLGVGFLQLPPVIVATFAGAFLTGAFAGFLGVTLLEKAVPRLARD